MSPADAAALDAWASERWLAACQAFATTCNASGRPINTLTARRMSAELSRIAHDFEHVGLDDLGVLRLAHARATTAGAMRAARAAAVALTRAKGGRHG